MATKRPDPLQGFGRGIFALKNFDALRKPRGRGLNGDASRPQQFNQGPPPMRPENVRPGSGPDAASKPPVRPQNPKPQPSKRSNQGTLMSELQNQKSGVSEMML